MLKPVIKVENLSKRYRLGLKEKQAKTLAGQLGNIIKSPWDNFQRLRRLSRFGEEDQSVFWALKDVSFEVKEGEVLGIIGKNGAGKSTLLKILSQITEPTSGRVELHGRVASLLEVGTGFHPELTGRENIFMNGTILGMTRREIDRKLEEIIDFSGVEKFIDTPVKFYSSGMKVRLGFSVAAHLEPEILIVDEVLAVGDYEFQQKCLGKMEDVSRNQGRTVLFVSHNMGAVKNLTTKSILLENGRMVHWERTDYVVNQYIKKRLFLHKKSYNSDSYFESISVGYEENENCFRLDESLRFKFTLNTNIEFPSEFRIGFTVSSIDDFNLVSGISNSVEYNGVKCFELEIKGLGLVEGDYKVSFSLGSGNIYQVRNELQVVRDVLTFSVVNDSISNPSIINWYNSYGPILKKSTDVVLRNEETKKYYKE